MPDQIGLSWKPFLPPRLYGWRAAVNKQERCEPKAANKIFFPNKLIEKWMYSSCYLFRKNHVKSCVLLGWIDYISEFWREFLCTKVHLLQKFKTQNFLVVVLTNKAGKDHPHQSPLTADESPQSHWCDSSPQPHYRYLRTWEWCYSLLQLLLSIVSSCNLFLLLFSCQVQVVTS